MLSSPEPSSARAPSAADRSDQVRDAVELLYQAVVTGSLAPGMVATQVALAEFVGVGRTPLREALRVAQSDGLVEFTGRRITISRLSALDVEELYVMRISLESLGLRATLPRLRSTDFANLEAAIAQMAHFAAAGELDELEAANKRFHAILVNAVPARTQRLLVQVDRHAERYRRALYAATPSGHLVAEADHRAILDAAKRGDVEATIGLMVAHYARTAVSVIGLLEPSYGAPRLGLAIGIATAGLVAPPPAAASLPHVASSPAAASPTPAAPSPALAAQPPRSPNP